MPVKRTPPASLVRSYKRWDRLCLLLAIPAGIGIAISEVAKLLCWPYDKAALKRRAIVDELHPYACKSCWERKRTSDDESGSH